MKGRLIKEMAVLGILALLGRPIPVYAEWHEQDGEWRYEQDGSWVRDGWVKDEGNWYYLEADGRMAVGWKKLGDFWYFLNPISDGTRGRMLTGWQWIDGRCYYLSDMDGDFGPEGAMYENGQTPDGYWVEESGAWVDARGMVVEIPGKGIMTKKVFSKEQRGIVGKSGGGGNGSSGGVAGGSGGNSGSGSVGNHGSSGGSSQETDEASNAAWVNWQIRFTDKDTHQTLLAESRQGRIRDGETLSVNFLGRIVDSENRIWESVQKPPLEWEVYGPEDRIFYVEYDMTGQLEEQDPSAGEQLRLQQWLDLARKQEALLTGEESERIPDSRFLVKDQEENDGRLLTLAGQLSFPGEAAVYVIGKNHEPNGVIIKNFFREELTYSQLVEDRFDCKGERYTVVRFSLMRKGEEEEKKPVEDALTTERRHWNLGDVLLGELDGEQYYFRCIDQDYSDQAGNHRQGALFLCDSVIPADFGSSYRYEQLEDGSYGYVFYPGPVVNFGDSNDYKYSRIRSWLHNSEEFFPRAKEIDIGVSRAYRGKTAEGMYGQLHESDLKGEYIGSQKLAGRLFILSVDEALKYRDWLWRFHGSAVENPQEVMGSCAKSYWLRNPVGTAQEHDTDLTYVVDLQGGNIRPAEIRPSGDGGDEELHVTGTTGVRPAFVMPQG